jgi:hypothetical protein
VLTVADVDRAALFFQEVGMREVERNRHVAVMELRGGTHLVLVPGPVTPGDAPFDLMVEDLVETRRQFSEKGLDPSAIAHDRIHDSFVVMDPDGHGVTFSSSHVVGEV